MKSSRSQKLLNAPLDNRRKALKLATTFQFERVTCPGVYLDNRSDQVHINISILGKRYKSPILPTSFPMFIHEQFHIEKVFKNCSDPFELGKFLKEEKVIISLIQNFKPLAEVAVNLKDFLYTKTHKSGSNLIREVLITKADSFPGTLAPKLEFISQSSIREVIAKPKKSLIHNNLFPERSSPEINLRKGRSEKKEEKTKQAPIISSRPAIRRASPIRAFSPVRNRKSPNTRSKSTSKKIILVNRPSKLATQTASNSNSEDHLPNFMRKTVSSRSKSPRRSPTHKGLKSAKHILAGHYDSRPGQGELNSFTKTVKIGEGGVSASAVINNIDSIKGKRYSNLNLDRIRNMSGAGDYSSSRDMKSGLLTADNVERLLESAAARRIYKDALVSAKMQEQLNNIRVEFSDKGNSYAQGFLIESNQLKTCTSQIKLHL